VALGLFAVAWGANQFVSVLVLYRSQRGVTAAAADALFGVYAVALVVALLLGGPAADRWGRARLVRPAVVATLVASGLLIAGDDAVGLLAAGRFLAGLASGAVFAAGTAWVTELSADAAPTAGARRAAMALSLGFGLGPLATGLLAQYSSAPLVVAYLPHLLLAAVAIPAVWRAPETRRPARREPLNLAGRLRVPAAGRKRFIGVVVPAAPWVFAAPSIAFVVLPAVVADHFAGQAALFTGALAALTLGVGVAVQRLARRLDRRDRPLAATVALAATATGCALAAVAAEHSSPLLAVAAALPLGAGYGLGLISGLLETQRAATPEDLAGLTALYYAMTYTGFALPLLLTELTPLAGYPTLLLALAALAATCAATVAVCGRPRGVGAPPP
jgi:MFS family permease